MASIELRAAAQQALEACKLIVSAFDALKPASAARNEPLQINAARASIAALEAALAEPTLQTCNCRWDGEVQVQQCTLHEAHVDAIHEWAGRANIAEKKLAALAEPKEKPWRCACGANLYIDENGAPRSKA